MQGPLKKNQCPWILKPNQYIDGVLVKAEYCGEKKNPKARNRNTPDEETQYELFCPKHMYQWKRDTNDDDTFV
jgi:hypothetical protein